MARTVVAVLIALIIFWLLVGGVRGDHNGPVLPLVPNTPLIQSEIQTQTVRWCVNTRSETYPQFVSQLADVHRAYTEDVGLQFIRVAWGTPQTTGCQVQHNMVDFNCGGCAAHVFYANWPVVIEYKYTLGYTDWRSTQGHELGHALLGLHEQYQDRGTIQCLSRPWTVMSCGFPYVRYPQPFDVENGCGLVLQTSWCGAQIPPPPPCEPTDYFADWGDGVTARWNPCVEPPRWQGTNGYEYIPSTGMWLDHGIDWSVCTTWGGRDSTGLGLSVHGGASVFQHLSARWYTAPPC